MAFRPSTPPGAEVATPGQAQADQAAAGLVAADNAVGAAVAAQTTGIPAHLLAKIEQAVAGIPDGGDGGGERIIEALLAAKTIDDLNQPWEGTSGSKLAGKVLRIETLTKQPSDYTDGPAIFLVVSSTDTKTGEKVTWTTSAVAVIIQLAVAYMRGMFPLIAEVVLAERETKKGYRPYHLRIIGAGGNGIPAGEPPF